LVLDFSRRPETSGTEYQATRLCVAEERKPQVYTPQTGIHVLRPGIDRFYQYNVLYLKVNEDISLTLRNWVSLTSKVAQIFQKSRIHLKSLGSRK